MPRCLLERIRTALTLAVVLAGARVESQQPESPLAPQPEKTRLASGVERLAGTEPSSKIQYARLFLNGSLHGAAKGVAEPPAPSSPPMLIAQCTLTPGGRYGFELFANFGGATDLAFYPPWVPATPQDIFPPRTQKVTITMDFLGYTHVKPLHRQWEVPVQTPGQYRFNPPGRESPNLEEIAYDLRYLLALPTLRLTLDGRSAEFLTTPLLDEIRKEPLCRAAGL
jgi:hypothetical protein